MESRSDINIQRAVYVPSKLTPELQKFCKQLKTFFESVETDTYNLKILVASFIEKIRTVLMKNNPVEVVEEFEKWIKFFTNEKRKLLEYINRKIVEDMETLKDAPRMVNKNIPWYNEGEVISTKQLLTETLDNESNALVKIDHPMYFRRRFLKSKLIIDEVNELRADESSLKNQDVVQKLYGEVLDPNGNLDRDKVMYKLHNSPDNDFQYKFTNDILNGPILLMYSKRKIVFTIRLDKSMKTPK